MESYYKILGISESADAVAIKKAYRSLVKKYHPDIYKGDDRETKFQEIQKAYEVLSDENKRAAYDRQGHASYEQSQKHGSAGYGSGGFNYNDFSGFNQSGSNFNYSFNGSPFGNFADMKTINDFPLWKRLLIFAGLAMLAIIFALGMIAFAIISFIIRLLRSIFN